MFKFAIATIAVLMLACIALADEPPQCNLPGFTVAKADLCRCGVACECADLQMVREITNKMHTTPAVNKVVKGPPPMRNPHGHTHSCTNPACPFAYETGYMRTWDHDVTKDHKCPSCGTVQMVVDTPSRMVAIWSVSPYKSAPPAVRYELPTVFQSFGASAGGCANGQCSTINRRR